MTVIIPAAASTCLPPLTRLAYAMSLLPVLLVLASAVIHASWNLLLRLRGVGQNMVVVTLWIGGVGLLPVLWAEWAGAPLPPTVWLLLVAAGFFQALYQLGLMMGYQSGHFTVVYPVVRSLPVLALAATDAVRGLSPAPLAWLGMFLVTAGCFLIPNTSLREVRLSAYRTRALAWSIVGAAGIVGYSIVDKLGMERVPATLGAAGRYFIWETIFSIPFFIAMLLLARQPIYIPSRGRERLWPAVVAAGVFLSYWLILVAYQLSPQISTVVALRQFSIVLGVVAGAALLHEPARGLRTGAAVAIVAGIICIAAA